MLHTTRARAYVNFGRWVADCPAGCGSARQLASHEAMFACGECHTISPIEWPDQADEIWEALQKRKFPKNRNWYPAEHDVALAAGAPHGQSAKELDEETHENGG